MAASLNLTRAGSITAEGREMAMLKGKTGPIEVDFWPQPWYDLHV